MKLLTLAILSLDAVATASDGPSEPEMAKLILLDQKCDFGED